MDTHIQSLSQNTPKARRRVRLALGLAKDSPVTAQHVALAQVKAVFTEAKHNAPTGKKRR